MIEFDRTMEDIFVRGHDEELTDDYIPFQRRLYLLSAQLYACCGVGSWCFNLRGELKTNSFPSNRELLMFLQLGGCIEYALEHRENPGGPMLLTDPLNLSWIADFTYNREGEITLLTVIGPIFNTSSSVDSLSVSLRELGIPLHLRNNLIDKLLRVPVLSYPNILQIVRMAHYTLTGKPVGPEDLHLQQTADLETLRRAAPRRNTEIDFSMLRASESDLLRMVREGMYDAISAERALAYLSSSEYGIGAPRREAKNALIILTARCSRAAEEGGLSPRLATDMETSYIRSMEKTERMTDLIGTAGIMVEDFAERVKKLRRAPGTSDAIQEVCVYIHSHLCEELDLQQLAAHVNYTEYYLSKKFHKELGIRLGDYIQRTRIERAKILLTDSDWTIQRISEYLQFNTRTYFSKVFRNMTGVSPVEYRRSGGKKEAHDEAQA